MVDAPAAPAPGRRRLPLILYAAVWLLVFTLNYTYILNLFYAVGVYTPDAVWMSALPYRSGITLQNPLAFDTNSFFRTHVSPYHLPFSLASYVVPVERIPWYAIFQGVMFASLTLAPAVYYFRRYDRGRTGDLLLGPAIALAFALNGEALKCVTFPHFEPAMAAFILLGTVLLVLERTRAAWVAFAVAASVREDAGFHVVALLAPVLLFTLLSKRRIADPKALARVCLAGIVYSVAAFALQGFVYRDHVALGNTFLGDPPLAHITPAVLYARLTAFATHARQIWWPFLFTVAWAAVSRNGWLLLGYLAYLPWLAVCLLAYLEPVAWLDYYYGFPFIVALGWPLIALGLREHAWRAEWRRTVELVAYLAMLGVSVLGLHRSEPRTLPRLAEMMVWRQPYDRAALATFLEVFNTRREAFGDVQCDFSVAALTPDTIHRKEFVYHTPVRAADTLLFFESNFGQLGKMVAACAEQGLDRVYTVRGTHLMVCSRRDLRADPVLESVLVRPARRPASPRAPR